MLVLCGYLGLLHQNYIEQVNVFVVENVFYGLLNVKVVLKCPGFTPSEGRN